MFFRVVSFMVLLTAALAGCQSGHKAKLPPPKDVTPGSTFIVVKNFLIPSGDNSVWFQDAQLYPEGKIRPNYPYCKFDAGAATIDGQIIKGKLTVSDVEYDEDGVGQGDINVSITLIHLQETSSGKSYRISCMLPQLSSGARFVTPAEVQGAVGGHMDIKVAP